MGFLKIFLLLLSFSDPDVLQQYKPKKVLVTSFIPQIIAKIKILKCLRMKGRQCKRKLACWEE